MITDYIRRRDKARMMEDEQQAVRPVMPVAPMNSPSVPLHDPRGQDFQIAQGHTSPESPDVMPDMRPPTLEDQRARAWDEYQRAVVTPPRKEKAWREAVYLGLQGLRDVFSDRPNNEPYRLLRDVNKDKEVARLSANVAALESRQKAQQEADYNKARTQTIYADDLRQQGELERKTAKDKAQIEYWGRKADQGDLKLANDEELIRLRDKWAESKDANDKRRLDLTEKEINYRNVRSKLDRESRERIAGWRESGLNRRQQLASEARQLLTQLEEAGKNKRSEEERALRERLAEIKAEAEGR